MKDIILFCAGTFSGMAAAAVIQLIGELLNFAIEDEASRSDELRDVEEVSLLVGATDKEVIECY